MRCRLTGVFLGVFLSGCGLAGASPVASRSACAHIRGHEYEVCTTYVVNATYGARLPFYKFGRSGAFGFYEAFREHCTGFTLGTAMRCRLRSRYYGLAFLALTRQTASWPNHVRVSLPRISIKAVSSNLQQNVATITDTESWKVTTSSGHVLFSENHVRHAIQLQRVRGLLLEKWVIIGIS